MQLAAALNADDDELLFLAKAGTSISSAIMTAFSKDFPQPFLRHFDQTVFFPHPLPTVVFDRNTQRARLIVEHQHSAIKSLIGMVDLFKVDG